MKTSQSHTAPDKGDLMTTLRRWARLTALAYLVLFVAGTVGFLLIRQPLYVPDDAMRTAANFVAHEGLARLGISLDLVTVLAQALAAIGFFVVFRRVNSVGAASITAFGLLNCAVVLMAAAFSATALQVALRGGPTSASEALTLYDLNAGTWTAAGLLFGLWLIPMGWLTVRSGMPRVLGWILVVGGVGGVLSTFVSVLAPDASGLAGVLPLAVVPGEVWLIGYLLIKGMPERPQGPDDELPRVPVGESSR
ncbi:DUF4386 domain-containing protein [Lysobacter korlensis]|uniref:DUF4386 domain-containing protein n=1 Tax=Lysobacter korlensis TaxID=553636 RepID=A0ABV6RWE4_9GAMM